MIILYFLMFRFYKRFLLVCLFVCFCLFVFCLLVCLLAFFYLRYSVTYRTKIFYFENTNLFTFSGMNKH